MRKPLMSLAAAALAGVALAAQNHVPESFDGSFEAIRPEAARHNHVLVVNVADAIPEAEWPLVVNYAASRMPINVWTNSIPASVSAALLSNPSRLASLVGDDKAVVAVFVEKLPSGASVLAVPCAFSRVDVNWLASDSPTQVVLRDRQAKMILKGIATACGAGATIEPKCSLFYGSGNLAGMDKTNITISPMAYFPMVEILRSLGGDEAVTPAYGDMDEEE